MCGFPNKRDTLLWRKGVAENYLILLKYFARREGIEEISAIVEKIKAAEKEANRAAQLYYDFINADRIKSRCNK